MLERARPTLTRTALDPATDGARMAFGGALSHGDDPRPDRRPPLGDARGAIAHLFAEFRGGNWGAQGLRRMQGEPKAWA
jgi:hypothetical protein